MVNLPVGGAHVVVALNLFVRSVRNDGFAACYTVPFALTDGLLISDSPFMVGETGLTPEMSVAGRAGDSNPFRYTWRPRHAAAACHATCMCHLATAPLAARFTHIPSGHGCCHVPYHMVMPGNVIVEQVQSFGCFGTPLEHNFVTM